MKSVRIFLTVVTLIIPTTVIGEDDIYQSGDDMMNYSDNEQRHEITIISAEREFEISIDDKMVGKTPHTLILKAGETAILKGYNEYGEVIVDVEIEGGKTPSAILIQPPKPFNPAKEIAKGFVGGLVGGLVGFSLVFLTMLL